ncbi:MAG: PAS domain-containing sensor histidine kinase [Leptolyngbyaceae cyanobacterium bins.349]|nr:PAS domain-containing sensor histidine kinase [Leptolyngbyaceae cyanobacterium bins.349]
MTSAQQSLAHYTAILSLMPDRVFRVNRQGENLDFKGTQEDAEHGIRREDVIGTNLRQFLQPDIAQGALDAIARALDTSTLQIFEYQIPKVWEPNAGELRDYEARMVVCGDNEVLVIERDITARKRSEMALRQSEERNRALLNAIPDLMFRIRRDGTYLDARADRLSDLAIAPEAMIGKTVYEMLPLEIAQQRMYYVEQAIQTGQPQWFEYQFWVHGEPRDYEARMVVSGPDEVLAIMRNITERKQAERQLQASMTRQAELYQQLQTLNANLEQQVEERTAQLQQKMQEIQALSQLKDEFLHAVSHDLRTPILGMRLVLQNLLNKPQSSASSSLSAELMALPRSVPERMIQSLDRQLSMLNALLEAHFSDVRGIQLQTEPLQLSDLVAAIATDLEPILLQHQASLSQEFPAHLPLVTLDPTQIRRVFENLITNALQHNSPGLHIRLQAWQEPKFIQCQVQDNGVGMTPAECESLFNRYVRGNRTRRSTGIGLGLYLCKQIVEAHGGAIGAISTPGNGATFWFTLPFENNTLEKAETR